MDVVGLVSGGKDSCYNMICAVKAGYSIVALANLHPGKRGELDSYMYQSVGSEGIEQAMEHLTECLSNLTLLRNFSSNPADFPCTIEVWLKRYILKRILFQSPGDVLSCLAIAESMRIPLYRREITGKPLNQNYEYNETCGDEVEDLYELLKFVKENHPSIKGVSAGAILSSYQRLRVENVCRRLDLYPLCYLWERDQKGLLREMLSSGLDAVVIKVAAIGLNREHLGKTLSEMEPTLVKLHSKYGVHPCGEGGEYETFVLDCPLFHERIVIEKSEIVTHQKDCVAPVYYMKLLELKLVAKSSN